MLPAAISGNRQFGAIKDIRGQSLNKAQNFFPFSSFRKPCNHPNLCLAEEIRGRCDSFLDLTRGVASDRYFFARYSSISSAQFALRHLFEEVVDREASTTYVPKFL
jgi:hypothetical protein